MRGRTHLHHIMSYPYHTITIPYLNHTIPYHTISYHNHTYHTIPYHTIPYTTLYHTKANYSKKKGGKVNRCVPRVYPPRRVPLRLITQHPANLAPLNHAKSLQPGALCAHA